MKKINALPMKKSNWPYSSSYYFDKEYSREKRFGHISRKTERKPRWHQKNDIVTQNNDEY